MTPSDVITEDRSIQSSLPVDAEQLPSLRRGGAVTMIGEQRPGAYRGSLGSELTLRQRYRIKYWAPLRHLLLRRRQLQLLFLVLTISRVLNLT